MKISHRTRYRSTSFILIVLIFLTGCNLPTSTPQNTSIPRFTLTAGEGQALITFKVHITQQIPPGDSIFLSVLDEVTGLAFNPQKYVMNALDGVTYSVSIPFDVGSVIKYRYSREGSSLENEYSYNDKPVRYRLYHVEAPETLEDIVSRWSDTEYTGLRGRMTGQVIDSSTRQPIPNILITAGGEQAFSLIDGTFLIEGLPPGLHNLVFYSLDGYYNIYQQGAVIAGDSTTPVIVELNPTRLVPVNFTINVPADTPADAPIRLAGNLYQLGNTFADLAGGVSTLASRMPVLNRMDDGKYTVTVNLPVGAFLEYKYTLGDGLWSSELDAEGVIQLRRVVVPDNNFAVNDIVESWQKVNSNPILFVVKVPLNTPKGESVSIQFNPGYGWLQPLPMWSSVNSQGEDVWKFYLTRPFNNIQTLKYRYCRQEQCGIADDEMTAGIDPEGRVVDLNTNPGVIYDEVLNWAWLNNTIGPINVPDVQVSQRGTDFIAGVALQSNYNPSWGIKLAQAVDKIQNLNVNYLIFSPTWTFSNSSSPDFEPLPSQDILFPDLRDATDKAIHQGLSIGIFPVPRFPVQSDAWWQDSVRNFSWWVSFFEKYSYFILHHAGVASSVEASSLILGGDWLYPALPNGLLKDGSLSNVPQDAELRWRELIKQVRARYSGSIAWALSYPDGVMNPPPFLDAIDQIYILWSASLSNQADPSVEDMQIQTKLIFDQNILPIQQKYGKPTIIAISYPSIDGSAQGCIAILGGGCLDYELLNLPNTDIAEIKLSVQDQVDVYNAVLSAINDTDWISGFVSMGYYPPVILQDKSISINGKPAGEVVWYWTQKFLGR